MASTIQLKTGTGSAVPSSLTQGELAINITNGLIYYGSGSENTVKQLESFTHITASGNISASGNIYSAELWLTDKLRIYNNVVGQRISGSGEIFFASNKFEFNDINIAAEGKPEFMRINGDTNILGNVTASANISASGYLYGSRAIINRIEHNDSVSNIHFANGIYVAGGNHITASANISASGTIIANSFVGDLTGNADTVTTNANLTGVVTSTGNATAIANGAITTAMQKHLQTFEFNGYSAEPASTNYFIPAIISDNKGPFKHDVDVGADGTTALLPSSLLRTGGKVMPYGGTCKLWKGWVGVNGTAAFNISIFKYTPVPNDATPDSLVLVKEFSGTAAGNSNLIAIDLTTGFVSLSAGDILITGISCESTKTVYFTSTLEVEWD